MIPRLFTLANLQDEMYKRLGSYSGGMKQRILLAQAVLGNPRVLILDEPTAGLDSNEKIRIRNLISEISFNKIALIATHVVADIEYISNEVLLLKKGELIDSGSPEALEKKIEGKVYEIKTAPEELDNISKQYKIGNISKDSEHIYVRVVSDNPPVGYRYTAAKPTLQDVYLYTFDD
ncbi:MAG TPA: ATP-binding cassette domain-containing protein [Candidatus Atribacteria bacterium]|nr:ATP-binding cassette domain-containing protein [Candidatus Atribacteria bacterium]